MKPLSYKISEITKHIFSFLTKNELCYLTLKLHAHISEFEMALCQ